MPFSKTIMAKKAYRLHGLECSTCGHKFENGESVYRHLRSKERSPRVIAYLCKNCYEAKFLDL
jgi:hypothetical protein